MLDSRADVGVAQIAFYIPAVLSAVFLLFSKHGKPRMAWIALFVFSFGELLNFIGWDGS